MKSSLFWFLTKFCFCFIKLVPWFFVVVVVAVAVILSIYFIESNLKELPISFGCCCCFCEQHYWLIVICFGWQTTIFLISSFLIIEFPSADWFLLFFWPWYPPPISVFKFILLISKDTLSLSHSLMFLVNNTTTKFGCFNCLLNIHTTCI